LNGLAIVSLAGPFSNVIMAAIMGGVAILTLKSAPGFAQFMAEGVQLSLYLALFNMLPIPPLDGGNVLSGLLPPNLASQFNKVRPYGFILLYALILSNGFNQIVIPPARFILSWLL
jgi:Zn-dependent protease